MVSVENDGRVGKRCNGKGNGAQCATTASRQGSAQVKSKAGNKFNGEQEMKHGRTGRHRVHQRTED